LLFFFILKKGSKRKKGDDEAKKETKKGKGKAKKGAAISRADFKEHAKALKVTINGVDYEAQPKEFKTNSFGWQLSGKTKIKVGDTEVTVGLNSNFVVQGSKNSDAGADAEEE